MTARTETPTSESVHPLVELARTSRVPIAELIGFQMETVGGGHAVASLQSGPQHAQPDGNPPRWCAVRLARRGHGHGVCDDIGARGIVHDDGIERQISFDPCGAQSSALKRTLSTGAKMLVTSNVMSPIKVANRSPGHVRRVSFCAASRRGVR